MAKKEPKSEGENLYRQIKSFVNVIEYHLERLKSEPVPAGMTYWQTVRRHKQIAALTKQFNALAKLEEMFVPQPEGADLFNEE